MVTRFSKISQRFAKYQKYRETLAELNSLSDREIHDLGVSRANIRDIARDAANGV